MAGLPDLTGAGSSPWMGDPEAAGAASASTLMEPAVAEYFRNVLNGQGLADTFGRTPTAGSPYSVRNPGGISEAAANLGAGFLGSIRAWHGTPHQFEPVEDNPFGEFRNEAIGNGEGAQAYGWGHYVAGNPKVAGDYQRNLGSGPDTFNVLRPEEDATITPLTRNMITQYKQDPAEILKQWQELHADDNLRDEFKTELPALHKLVASGDYSTTPPGALLEVHVKPEESELLDWDRPLSEQSPGVQEALQKYTNQLPDNGHDWTGQMLYQNLARSPEYWSTNPELLKRPNSGGIQQKASDTLHDLGIPGIKYLDAGSRNLPPLEQIQNSVDFYQDALQRAVRDNTSDQGYLQQQLAAHQRKLDQVKAGPTSNYVIFDPSNLKILGRNGQRLTPVDHNPFEDPTQ